MNGRPPYRASTPPMQERPAPPLNCRYCDICGNGAVLWDPVARVSRCYWCEKSYRLARIDESLKRIADALEWALGKMGMR